MLRPGWCLHENTQGSCCLNVAVPCGLALSATLFSVRSSLRVSKLYSPVQNATICNSNETRNWIHGPWGSPQIHLRKGIGNCDGAPDASIFWTVKTCIKLWLNVESVKLARKQLRGRKPQNKSFCGHWMQNFRARVLTCFDKQTDSSDIFLGRNQRLNCCIFSLVPAFNVSWTSRNWIAVVR